MTRYDTLLDACARLYRNGYRFFDMEEGGKFITFTRASWSAYLTQQKNGRWRVEIY